MRKILIVAKRDFLATVITKGFIITVMIPPLVWAAIIVAFPRMMNNRVPAVTGIVTVIDQAGQVAPGIRRYLDPQAMAERRDASFNRAIESSPMAGTPAGGGAAAQRAVLGELPRLEIAESPVSALGEQKERLTHDAADRQLAVSSCIPTPYSDHEGIFGSYDLFVRRTSPAFNGDSNAAAEAIVDARVRAGDSTASASTRPKWRARRRRRSPPLENPRREPIRRAVADGFHILLMISVMSSGQYL